MLSNLDVCGKIDKNDCGMPMLKFCCFLLAVCGVFLGGISEAYAADEKIVPFICFVVGCFLSAMVLLFIFFFFLKKRNRHIRHLQKMENIGLLAGGVAHDFNNILTGIRGAAEMLHKKSAEKEEVKKYADVIIKACERSAYLTSRLLFVARDETYSFETMDVGECVQEAVFLLQHGINEKSEVIFRNEAEKSAVCGNKNLLESALLNLGFNARDAVANRNGKIEFIIKNVSLTLDDVRHCLIGVDVGEFVEISVRDNGCGIPDKIVGRLFDPFFTTKQEGKGTGLGLPAVYEIVQKHGGTLKVETSAEGSCFYLYLPSAKAAEKSEDCSCLPKQKIEAKILLADDDAIVRELLKDIISSFGAVVLTAATAEEAEKTLAEHKDIDIVMLDMIMPQKNGAEVLESLKRINSDVRVLFMSGGAEDEQISELLTQNKRTDFLRKPCRGDECYEKLVGMLAKK